MPATGQSGTGRQREQSEVSRQKLLDAAAIVFARQGFHKASLQAIGEEAGISRGSIVWHFGTKDALLEAVVERSYLSWAREVESSEAGKPGGRQAIVRVIEAHRRFIEESPAENRLYYALIAEVSANEELAERVRKMHAELYLQLHGYIKEGQEAGEISSQLDPEVGARLVLSTLGGIGHLVILVPDADVGPIYREVLRSMEANLAI
ncbi:MAG TPA: TetR/AcrR family transcriptional regulator [Solirubrobacterales bacterium]|nr:TetR/AcrR family transcriptional regulator [Solirubrobacterales bacterium]HMW45697.1 TetR/AcrR family transcriptional regulator [Solirubrobacterales bacterium]HMX70873.1 TetR/AcrR family transcriptional regulator [Solirubrobacterales bacterium]HMY25079.1 TetR/AcrR family transcriptional regulator [Solirubrobacterales bacterium]HNA23168.1 TetR/AcrR family transcriptional regulator [Solirubrobacterales bacterium]